LQRAPAASFQSLASKAWINSSLIAKILRVCASRDGGAADVSGGGRNAPINGSRPEEVAEGKPDPVEIPVLDVDGTTGGAGPSVGSDPIKRSYMCPKAKMASSW
jgi:hypothetical protein